MGKVTWDSGTLEKRLKRMPPRIDQLIDGVIDRNAVQATQDLKQNAPWHDDTGLARASIAAVSFHRPTGEYKRQHTIIMAHGVHYGIWLEIANSGKYQVIMPTVRSTSDNVMRDMDHLFRKLNE